MSSLRDRVDGLRDQALEVFDGVKRIRADVPVLDAGWETFERDAATGGGLLAGAIAFRLFLLIVPLLLLLYAGLGFWSASDQGLSEVASEQLELTSAIVSSMESVGETAQQGRWVTLLVGGFALVLAVRTLIRSLRIVHLLAWRLERRPLKRQLLALLVGILVLAGLVVFSLVAQVVRAHTPGGGLLASVIIGSAAAGVWLLISQLLPRADDTPWTVLIPGAVLMGLTTQLLHAATVFYFASRVEQMSDTYGPLGAAMLMLLWLFIFGRGIVGSAMLNATLWDRRARGKKNYAPIDRDVLRTLRPPRAGEGAREAPRESPREASPEARR